MSSTLSSPRDLYSVLISYDVKSLSTINQSVWKTKEHFYEGLRYFVREIGGKDSTLFWHCYCAIIHAIVADDITCDEVDKYVIPLMVSLIDRGEFFMTKEICLLGELILMLMEGNGIITSDCDIYFPLVGSNEVQYTLHLVDGQSTRLLNFFLHILSALIPRRQSLSNNFNDFAGHFVISTFQALAEIDIGTGAIGKLLDTIEVIHPFRSVIVLDGIFGWIENQSLSLQCGPNDNLETYEKLWSRVSVIIVDLLAVGENIGYAIGLEERICNVIDYCVVRLRNISDENYGDSVQLKRKLMITLSGSLSVISAIYPFLRNPQTKLSQIVDWCVYSKSSIWSVRLFSQALKRLNKIQIVKDIHLYFGVDSGAQDNININPSGIDPNGFSETSSKRIRIVNSNSCSPTMSTDEGTESILIVSLFRQYEHPHRGDMDFLGTMAVLSYIALSVYDINPALLKIPRSNILTSVHKYFLLVLSVCAEGSCSEKWLCSFFSLFTSKLHAFEPCDAFLKYIPPNKILLSRSSRIFLNVVSQLSSLQSLVLCNLLSKATERNVHCNPVEHQNCKGFCITLDYLYLVTPEHYSKVVSELVEGSKQLFASNDTSSAVRLLINLSKYLDECLRVKTLFTQETTQYKQVLMSMMTDCDSLFIDNALNRFAAIMLHNQLVGARKNVSAHGHEDALMLLSGELIDELMLTLLTKLSETDDSDGESQSFVVDYSEKSSFVLAAINLITTYWIVNCGSMHQATIQKNRAHRLRDVLLKLLGFSSRQYMLISAIAKCSAVVLLHLLLTRPIKVLPLDASASEMNFVNIFLSVAEESGRIESNSLIVTQCLSIIGAVSCLVDPPVVLWSLSAIAHALNSQSKRSTALVSPSSVDYLSKFIKWSGVLKPIPSEVIKFVMFPMMQQSIKKSVISTIEKILRVGTLPFWRHHNGMVLAQLIVLPLEKCRSLLFAARDKDMELFLPKEYLLEELSHTLYYVLLSESIFTASFEEIFTGKLWEMLSGTCSILGIQLNSYPEGEVLSEKALNHLVIQLIWSLGSTGNTSIRAAKALKVICFIYHYGKWKVEEDFKFRPQEQSQLLLVATSSVLSKCFLFILSYLLQQNLTTQKSSHQIQSLIALHGLVKMLEPEAIAKFFPKIWNIIDISLQSTVWEVKLRTVEVAMTLCKSLPPNLLIDNILVILACLFSIFFDRHQESSDGISYSETPTLADQLASSLPTSVADVTKSLVFIEMDQFGTYIKKQKEISGQIEEHSLALISDLLRTFDGDVGLAVSLIIVGGIPEHDELRGIKTQHTIRVSELSIDQIFSELHHLLKHEASQVRILALKVCLKVLRNRKTDLYQLLNTSMNNSTVSMIENAVGIFVKDLLNLTTGETDKSALQLVGQCLGEMGAISPSLMNIDTTASSKKFSTKNFLNPFSVTLQEFSLVVLQKYIILGFKGASTILAQDQSGFAIQEILQTLKMNQRIDNSQHIPEDIRKILNDRGILETVEPFWASKYKIKDVPTKHKTPFYRPGMEYNRWISLLCRHAISLSKGPLKHVFDACRGVVRHRLDLCQFLLPYLLLDVSMFGDPDPLEDLLNEIDLILVNATMKEEIVGITGQQSFSHLCVQTIFNIVDIFEDWKAAIMEMTPGDNQMNSKSETLGSKSQLINSINGVLDKISLTKLSDAAMVTKSYTRAMRYIEIHARDQHRADRLKDGKDRNHIIGRESSSSSLFSVTSILKRSDDKAGGELPLLSENQINTLGTIYGELEDMDALCGIQILRRVNGYSESLRHKVTELMHNDDWLGALLEYELIQNSPVYQKSWNSFGVMVPGSNGKLLHNTPTSRTLINQDDSKSRIVQRKEMLYRQPKEYLVAQVNRAGRGEEMFSLQDISDIEKGKMRCLIELGHLESVIYQSYGRSSVVNDLQRALTPIGLEASWRLMKWDDARQFVDLSKNGNSDVDSILTLTEADEFRLRVGKSLFYMQKGDKVSFNDEITQARRQAIVAVAAASMESYGRAYPALCRLHMLHELEASFDLISVNSRKRSFGQEASLESDPNAILDSWEWNNRLKYMSDSSAQRSQLLAIRRTILGLMQMPTKVAANWLDWSNELRYSGKYDSARLALKNAVHFGMEEDAALIEECRLLKEQGHAHKALLLLEPSEIDLALIQTGLKVRRKASIPVFLDTDEKRKTLAERIHLATQIMIELHQAQSGNILDRFETILMLHKKWDQAYYDYGKYLEFLFSEVGEKDLLQQTNSNGGSGSGKLSGSDSKGYFSFVEGAIDKYGQCLRLGGNATHQALPKLLTLWFSFTEMNHRNSSSGTSSTASTSSALQVSQNKVNELMQRLTQDVGANIWFHAIQQIVSRVGHKHQETVNIIEALLLKVLTAFPKQGIWHIAHLMYSLNRERREIAKKVLRETHRQIKDLRPGDGRMLVESQHLFQSLSNLATLNCNQRKINWQMDKKIQLDLFLVPTQSILLHGDLMNPIVQSSHHTNASDGFMFISKFGDIVDVASSKAKPKTLRFETTCGKCLKFLCKQEKDGDLRKDVRMMEFNNSVNRLFQHDAQGGRQRNLRLRTYAVVCLNEECGILEWVENTECLRHLITQAHANPNWSDLYPMLHVKDIYLLVKEFQEKFEDDLVMMIKSYEDLVGKYKPCFHKWFLERFKDATSWYEARLLYTRSVAVWSSVGHVIGLGDRHTENILIDVTNGECVHVDFDCLFDKGLTLLRPEIIPFRLTQNMVDAMGVCGVEGTYRRTLEVSLKVLRENKEILLNVLEPFLRDPTVAWSRGGRAQKNDQATNSKQQLHNEDQVNNEATEMMARIAARLSGEYYFFHPGRDKLIRGAKSRNQQIPSKGVGPARDELMPLSISGQAKKLIDEATAIENLAQLYYGWQAWL